MEIKRGFKKRTIENMIQEKMDAWIKSLPEDLRKKVEFDYIVTGGAIASMLLGEQPNDYDVYFKTDETAVLVADHYLSLMLKSQGTTDKVSKISAKIREGGGGVSVMIKSAGVLSESSDVKDYQYFESLSPEAAEQYFKKVPKEPKDYSPIFISSNAITLAGDVQIITRFTGDPAGIHKNFDFVHATNYYTKIDGLVLNQKALEALLSRTLIYNGSLYPICAMFRTRKFIERGFTISAGEILKICYDVNKLDLDDHSVLEEQLVGVDAAYFHQVLSILKKDVDRNLDRTYIFEVINRVFGD